jgi:predicted oxidoreductase
MEYCKLQGRKSSRIIMGCMRIADKPLLQTEELIKTAVSAGVNTFDLADIYGNGNSEKVFGVAMKDIGIARDSYILQTKCGIRKSEMGKWFDFSKEYIVSSVEGSLKRLNTDYVDMLLLHRPDTLVEPEEVADAIETLLGDGKIRAVGVSNFSSLQIKLLENYGLNIAANQVQFSLAHTPLVDAGFNVNMYNDEAVQRAGDTLEYCRTRGIALQAWSPLGYGFLEGVFIGNENFPRLNATLEVMAEEKGCSPSALALAWILRHPAFAQVVTGTTNPERMKLLCQAADVALTREEWYKLYLSNERVLP